MIKKILFFLSVFLMMVLVVFECKMSSVGQSYLDYCNIMLCNFNDYHLYGKSGWDLTHLFFYYFLLIGGIYFLSEKIHNFNKGFHSMAILRYQNCNKYMYLQLKQVSFYSMLYSGMFLFFLFVSIVLFDLNALFKGSLVVNYQQTMILFYLLLYFFKIISIFCLIGIWILYLITTFKFELLLLGFITTVALILFIDAFTGVSVLTLEFAARQIVYLIFYIVINVLSYIWVSKKYVKKELW